jgi:hypothetical protein
MYEYNLDYIKEITGICADEAESLTKYFAKLPIKIRIETFKLQTDYVRQNRDKLNKEFAAEYYYAMHLLALRSMKRIESGSALKQELTQFEAAKIHKIRVERIKAGRGKKESKKAMLIKDKYLEEIKKLYLEDGLSWREISEYLAKHHKIKISHGYIQQKFTEAMMYEG